MNYAQGDKLYFSTIDKWHQVVEFAAKKEAI